MTFFRLLASTIALALVIVVINGAPSIQHGNDNNDSPVNDLSHLGEEPYEDSFEDNVNSLSSISVESDVPADFVNKEQVGENSVGRQRRAPKPFKFNGRHDTNSNSAREAFRNAKDQNGIARSQPPLRQYHVPDKHNQNQLLRQYDFKNQYGEKISIRKDRPITYPDGGRQGPHYNAGPAGGKLQQHHNFPLRPRG